MRKLPIGIQSFEKIREDDFLYVDKTQYVYELAKNNVPYFLSRPRRFGKSLLLSTMKAYWEGRVDLFKHLEIERLKKENNESWEKYPVFYFDFNGKNYQKQGALEEQIEGILLTLEEQYGNQYQGRPLEERFARLLELAFEQTGHRCVVLIDEYDKPLLDVIDNIELQQRNKDFFKGFFSVLKSKDSFIHFIFITGVTKFHKVSIFSDLNQLVDISLHRDYSGICGITEDELKLYFLTAVKELAEIQGISVDECYATIKKNYDGYHFHQNGLDIYNPYSILNCFFSKEFGSYWFETGSPSFLVSNIRKNNIDVRKFSDKTLYSSESSLKDYTGDSLDIIPLLYQTGYLTIADYDSRLKRFTLAFPNDEVKYGFLESLIPVYTPVIKSANGLDIFSLNEYVENGQIDNIKNVFVGLFASITYTHENVLFEHYFQTVIFIVFTLLGKFVQCEIHTFSGRIDCIVETKRYVYLFEFKRDKSAADAIEQIDSKEYTLPFAADNRKLFKIGVNFDSEKRIINDWIVQ